MAEIRNPQKYYYAMRGRFARATKQIGHKLSLATSEEEDALLWAKYEKVLKQWRDLEHSTGISRREDWSLRQRRFWKPIFNETYIELTQQLNALYEQRSGMDPNEERNAIDAEIEAIKEKRKTATTYVDRETGEEMCWR